VLVSESYSPGGMGFFGAVPHLERVYHASWPGPVRLAAGARQPPGRTQSTRARSPRNTPSRCVIAAPCPRPGGGAGSGTIATTMCASPRTSPDLRRARCSITRTAFGTLYPRRLPTAEAKIVIPDGRARVDVEVTSVGTRLGFAGCNSCVAPCQILYGARLAGPGFGTLTRLGDR
jgi:hypothetical protein